MRPAADLPVTRARIERALDSLATLVAGGVVTADGIAPIWARLEQELAGDPLHDRIMARAGRVQANDTTEQAPATL